MFCRRILTVCGVSDYVIDDGHVTKRSINIVGIESRSVEAVEDNQLQMVPGCSEQTILRLQTI